MTLGKELSYDAYDDENLDGIVTTVDDKFVTIDNYGEQINNNSRYLIDNH